VDFPPYIYILLDVSESKVGEIPTVRSSDTDADLPTVSADLLFTNFSIDAIASSL
jgi:hypothetical protein